MKKIRLLLLFIFVFMIYTNVFASTDTFVRTNENLRVPSRVRVTSENQSMILDTPSVSAKEKVYDFADLLTDVQEDELYKSILDFQKKSGYDVAIVTTNDIGNKDMIHYADDFYHYNDFGNEGLIFVIKKTSSQSIYMCPKTYVEESDLGLIYDNSRVKEILKYIYEHNIRNGDYYAACTNYVKILSGLYDNFGSGNYRISSTGEVTKYIPWVAIVTLSFTTTFIIVIIIITKLNLNKRVILEDNIGKCVDTSSLFVKTLRDQFVDSSIEKR